MEKDLSIAEDRTAGISDESVFVVQISETARPLISLRILIW